MVSRLEPNKHFYLSEQEIINFYRTLVPFTMAVKYYFYSDNHSKTLFLELPYHNTDFLEGIIHYHLLDTPNALIALNKALSQEPTSSNILTYRALALMQSGQTQEALTTLEQAFECDKDFSLEHPTNIRNIINLIEINIRNRKYTQAREYADKVFNNSKVDIKKHIHEHEMEVLLNNLGSIFYGLNENNQALDYYLQSKEIFQKIYGNSCPEYARILNNIATVKSKQNKFDDAISDLKQALNLVQRLF